MTLEETLQQRAGSRCELCSAATELTVYAVPPVQADSAEHALLLCATCRGQVAEEAPLDADHWRCLNDSMWTPVPAVQVLAWRLLKRLSAHSWAQDQLEMLYLEPELQSWAEAEAPQSAGAEREPTRDCHGAELQAGDTVTLIKDLTVKGAGFTAKRGTAVRGISLTDNPEQIEGRVNGVRIVLLTQYLKKQG